MANSTIKDRTNLLYFFDKQANPDAILAKVQKDWLMDQMVSYRGRGSEVLRVQLEE
jgi:hypothetical protein